MGLYGNKGILPVDADVDVQLTHFDSLKLIHEPANKTVYRPHGSSTIWSEATADSPRCLRFALDLPGWFRMLPNVTRLDVHISEIFKWIRNEGLAQRMAFFLRRLSEVQISCSPDMNSTISATAMEKLQSFMIQSGLFPRLEILSLVKFPSNSIADLNVDQWIRIVASLTNRTQLKYFNLEFENEAFEANEWSCGSGLLTVNGDSCVLDIYRSSRPEHVQLWIETRRA